MECSRRTIFLFASLSVCLGNFAVPTSLCAETSKKTSSSAAATAGSVSGSSLYSKIAKELDGKNFSAALKTAEQWISREPKSAVAYYLKGRALTELGNKDRAIEAFSQAIKLDPKMHAAYKDRGWLLYFKGHYKQSESDFTTVVTLNPGAPAYTGRAYANAKLGNVKGVIADCTRSIQLDPKDRDAYELRANAYFKIGPYELSVEDWKKACALEPKAERLWRGLGMALAKTYDHDAVIEEMTRAINSGVKTLEIYKIRADASYKNENYKQAAEDLTVILTKFGPIEKWQRWDYLKLRARSYLRGREYAKAEKDCTDALAIAPDDSKSYFCRGDVREHMGKYKESIQDLTQVIKLDPNEGRAFSIRGKIYEHLGQTAKAASDRKAAIKLGDKQWGI